MNIQTQLLSVSAMIRPDYRRQLKSGEFHLRLFLYQNPRLKKSYRTDIRVMHEEWAKITSETSSLSVRHKKEHLLEVLAKAKAIIRILRDDFSFEEFEERMLGVARKNRCDITDVYDTFRIKIEQLRSEHRIGSVYTYENVMRSLQSYRSHLKFHQVTVQFLYKYERKMLESGCKKSTVGIRMRHLKAIVNMAKCAGVVTTFDYPFGRQAYNKYEIPSSRRRKKALLQSELMSPKTYRSDAKEEWARDMWLLSFYCNGMNMSDVFNLKWSNVSTDFLRFIRGKTKRICRREEPVDVFLTNEAKCIIECWAISDCKYKDAYLFGIVGEMMDEEEKFVAIRSALRVVNNTMGQIAKRLHIKSRVTSTVARHTWATVLMHAGVPIPYISKGLVHTSVLTTENYLADFEQQYKRDIGKILSAAVTNYGRKLSKNQKSATIYPTPKCRV